MRRMVNTQREATAKARRRSRCKLLSCCGAMFSERREPATDDHPHGSTQERQQHDQRPQRAQRDVRRKPVAHRQRLRELHDVVADDRAVHAPFAAIGALGREAERRARRDRRTRRRQAGLSTD